MTKRVLMTGATGFVGRHVLRVLAARDARVTAVVRDGSEAELEGAPGVEARVSTPDLFAESAGWWAEACRDIDVVVHVAWYAEPGAYLQSPRNLACVSGTMELALGAAEAGVRKFVGIGTCFEYDLGGSELDVGTPLEPLTPYAGAKAAAYLALSTWFASREMDFAWCRLFHLYGEGEDDRRLVPYLRARLAAGEPAELTGGEQVRDFMDAAEAGRLIADVALGDAEGPLNICSGVPVTVRQLAEAIADEYGRRDLLRFGSRPAHAFDPPRVVGVPSVPPRTHLTGSE